MKNSRPPNELTPVNQLISRSLGTGFMHFINRQWEIFGLWPSIIGPELAAKTKLHRIRDGRLTVLVAAPAWIDHLNYKKYDFLLRLNKHLNVEDQIQDIIFKVGPLD